ncbi:MAG: C69 family dipeptidase [Acidobacteriota bacterium]|nr:C69 family dipeptidase [Acidobacteriota bacterium]
MCDIVVALPDVTATGRVIFGKNSDRPAGECQVLVDSADERRRGDRVSCAFVSVPDVTDPRHTVGCRPYWCWGYETGMNDAGVVGGNTAVYTRSFWEEENRKTSGLTGMELLRLGLERGATAAEVVHVIAGLLAEFGQWGPAVVGKTSPDACYENAFLIADPGEAWILETSGRRWVARRHRSGVAALSNQLTIRKDWTDGSEDLLDHAVRRGWWKEPDGALDFALAYSDHEHYARQVSHIRWSRSQRLLREHAGSIDVGTVMRILRDHYEDTFLEGPQFDVFRPDFLTLCMHDSPAAFTWGNTATSVVVVLDPDAPASSPLWCGYQPPCSSVYLASSLAAGFPPEVSRPGGAGLRSESPATVEPDRFETGSLWWRTYRLLSAVRETPLRRRRVVRSAFDPIERAALARVRGNAGEPPERRDRLARESVELQLREIDRSLSSLEREWGLVTESV